MADDATPSGGHGRSMRAAWARWSLRCRLVWRSLFRGGKRPRNSRIWRGDYPSWSSAAAASGGYDGGEILEKCRAAVLKVKTGEAAYERDSVLFDEVQYSWGLLAGLQFAAARNGGRLSVLDFGGSLGSTYFQNRAFLGRLPACEWHIVEQPNFVRVGQAEIADDQLRFHPSVAECVAARRPNVAILSSSLQYLPDPHAVLAEVALSGFDVVILDRTPFIPGPRDLLTVQTVPAKIYRASYPAWFFARDTVDAHFAAGYDLLARPPWWCSPPVYVNYEHLASWEGAIFVRKNQARPRT